MADPRRAFAVEVVEALRRAGHRALWAGGCVRDLLLGIDPSDYDVATDATPERVMRLFRRTVPVGASFGVVRVLGPPGAGEVEVATFRTDGAYLDGRRPDAVTYSTPEADASRRDFTVNGMFFDPIAEEVIDHVGGRADLDARRLRAIGDPSARFAEDKLRLLRAIRFASRFGLEVEAETWSAIVAMSAEVVAVSAERVATELRKMLGHPSRARAIAQAVDAGLIAAIMPGADVGVAAVEALRGLPASSSFPLALAAMLHRLDRAEVDGVCRSLKLANAERERAAWLVGSRPALDDFDSMRTSARKRLLAEPGIFELVALDRAISLAGGGDGSTAGRVECYLRDLPEGPIAPEPLVGGADLRGRGLTPGPSFKRMLESLYNAQLEGEFGDVEGGLAWLERRGSEV